MAQFNIASLGRAAQGANLIQQLRDRQAAQQNQGAIQGLARMAMGGDRQAKMELGARDPQMLGQLQGAINKMDTGQRERAKHAMEMQGRLANYVQSAPPPLKAQAYREALGRLAQNDPEVAAKLPQEYQPGMEDRMFALSVKASDMLTNAQRDIQAQGVPRSSEEFPDKLEKERKDSGGKVTKSDRIMALAGKMSRGEATQEEEREYDLLVRADPMDRLMRKFDVERKGGTPAKEPPPGALPEAEALEVLKGNPSEENINYFKETYGYAPSL